MKEKYISPDVKLVGFVAEQKIAANLQQEISWDRFGITLSSGTTNVSKTDIKIPIKG